MLAPWILYVCFAFLGVTKAVDKACPYKPIDLIFALDGSGSEGLTNFKKQLDFVANFTQQFTIGPNNTRVALVTFDTVLHNGFYLNQYNDNTTVLNAIAETQYHDGETNTHLALQFIRDHTLSQSHDGRNVTKIVIVLTDGRSLEPDQTQKQAELLKANPLVTVIAVGIGNHVDSAELQTIASDRNHTFQVASFDLLSTLETELTDKTSCNKDMSDICFVLDSSGSEGSSNFAKQLEFVNLVINEFSFEGTDHTQACVVTFSTTAHTEINLNTYHNKDALMQNVLRIPYRDGETMTNIGIDRAVSELRNHHHARDDANKVLIVLTDGRSTEPTDTERSANSAHRRGMETYAIGIGPRIDKNELDIISSEQDHTFTVDNFDQLVSIHQEVVDRICAKSALRTTTTTTTTSTTTTTTTTLPPTTTKAACGLLPADIVFVLDSSDSEGADNFRTEVEFVNRFASQFSIGVNNVQFSVVTFSDDVRNDFYFNTYHSRNEVLHAIRQIAYIGQGTNTSEALKFVRENTLLTNNGARANSTKFVIVITDGRSDDPDATKHEASLLQREATVIAVGVGPRVDHQELNTIATGHHVVNVDSFALLKDIQNQLTDLACEKGE